MSTKFIAIKRLKFCKLKLTYVPLDSHSWKKNLLLYMKTLGKSPVMVFIQVSKCAQTLRESFLVEDGKRCQERNNIALLINDHLSIRQPRKTLMSNYAIIVKGSNLRFPTPCLMTEGFLFCGFLCICQDVLSLCTQ